MAKKTTAPKTVHAKKAAALKKKLDTLREQIKKAKAKATSDCVKAREKAAVTVSNLKRKISALKSKPQQYVFPFKGVQIQ